VNFSIRVEAENVSPKAVKIAVFNAGMIVGGLFVLAIVKIGAKR
jgi:hypothetical protein